MMTPAPMPPERGNPDPAFTKKESAAYIRKKSTRTIDRYIALGLLKPVVLGPSQIGIRKSELDRFLSGDDRAPLPLKRPFNRPRDARGRIARAA